MKKRKPSYGQALAGLRNCVLATIDCCEEALDGRWDRSDSGFIAMRDDLAYWMAVLKQAEEPVVRISVHGGVAYADACPKGVKCVITDHDNR